MAAERFMKENPGPASEPFNQAQPANGIDNPAVVNPGQRAYVRRWVSDLEFWTTPSGSRVPAINRIMPAVAVATHRTGLPVSGILISKADGASIAFRFDKVDPRVADLGRQIDEGYMASLSAPPCNQCAACARARQGSLVVQMDGRIGFQGPQG